MNGRTLSEWRNTDVNGGTLIAFEGIDGSGKSTQLQRLEAHLRSSSRDVVSTREPTDGPIGRRIRAMARSGERIDPQQELQWFVDDRREHVASVIGPALAEGRIVLCDRYFLSSVAYQGARGLDPEEILTASETAFPQPALALIFEVDPKLGLERVGARGSAPEPGFEEIAFLTRVAEIFRRLDRSYIEHIDASPDPEVVCERMVETVERRLGLP